MIRNSRCLFLVIALILLMVSCTSFAAVKPIKLVFGNLFAADSAYTKADIYFKELVEKNSKGRIVIDYFPGAQLGSEQEMLQATKAGAQQICHTTPGMLAVYLPKLATLELPYLFRDQQHYLKGLSKGFLINQEEIAAKTGMYVFSWRALTPRQLSTKFPVNKLEDIKGLKIRVAEVPVRMALWKALGTIPTPIPMGDVYTALATGTIDAQENPIDIFYSFNLFEQQKYVALTNHIRGMITLMINKKSWDSLTVAQRKILNDAQRKSADKLNKYLFKSEKDYNKKLLKKGVKFTEPDLGPFIQKAKTIWGQYGDTKLIKRIEAIK
jgi:tripartite ATP-independent transporter DctP family solute receptor